MDLDTVILGDCLDILPDIPDASVDAVITDPPYPHIKRDYGYWTEAEWWELIVEGVIPQVRRILKPTGSAVFILQPNSEKVGKMRGWLWEFMAWVCREWNMVQDVYWWNITAMPCGVSAPRERGLTRASVKSCVWLGNPDCHRDQDGILLPAGEWHETVQNAKRRGIEYSPSGQRKSHKMLRIAKERGGVTPFNLLPIANNRSNGSGAGNYGHGAGTPLKLADWWMRYIVPPGGLVLDPFAGVATMALAAIQNGDHFIMIEKEERYCEIGRERIAAELAKDRQMELAL